jgi:hypothetical protein
MRWVVSLLFIAIGLAAAARPARAQAAAAAEVEFDRARQLMTEGKIDEGCAAFERSQKLDPQIGTRYNLGVCFEKLGKLSSSWSAFREVAQRDTNEGRRKDAARRATALAPRLTRLLVNSASSPAGFAVKLNGTDATNLLGIETPVDPGPYTVVATAPGFKDWTATVSATGEGLTVTVAIPALTPIETAPIEPPISPTHPFTAIVPPRPVLPAPPAPAPSHRRTIAMITGGGGVALAVGGVVIGALARSKWHEAQQVCGGSLSCPSDGATAQANALGDAARTRASVATVLVGAGVVALGVGAALWFTAPAESSRGVALVPSASPDGASLTMMGRF